MYVCALSRAHIMIVLLTVVRSAIAIYTSGFDRLYYYFLLVFFFSITLIPLVIENKVMDTPKVRERVLCDFIIINKFK